MSTNGNVLSGHMAAGLGAAQVHALCHGLAAPAARKEVLYDGEHHAMFVTRLTRNPRCGFDHTRWDIQEGVDRRSIGDWLPVGASLGVPGHDFVDFLGCVGCERSESVQRLEASLDASTLECPGCGELRHVSGFNLRPRVTRDELEGRLDQPLSGLGVRPGEIFAIHKDGEAQHYEVPTGWVPKTTVVLVGLGNIGSHAVPLMARDAERFVLVDPDGYEVGQQWGQDIRLRDVHQPKVAVQAARVGELNRDIEVIAWPRRIETLPTGMLRNAVVVSALDSIGARVRLAARVWHAGSPFVDTAVGGGESQLSRTNVYIPDEEDGPCFECGLDEMDGAEDRTPCEGGK